jgi:hypothetical protein
VIAAVVEAMIGAEVLREGGDPAEARFDQL